MVAAVVDAVEKPVTVKMRIGWDEDHIFAIENAKAVERCWWTSGSSSWAHTSTNV